MMSRSPQLARLGGGFWGSKAVSCLGLLAVLMLGGWGSLQPAAPGPTPTHAQSEAPKANAASERVVIHCRDGRRVEGRLIRQSPAEVVIKVAGIETSFKTADILRVTAVPPVAEHYKKLRAVIADDDTEQLLLLIDWLRDREAYSIALKELAAVDKIDPGNAQAARLKLQIESMIVLRSQAQHNPGTPTKTGDSPRKPRKRQAFPVLTPDQINLIKVYEVDLLDPPRMSVDRETVRDLINAYEGHELIPQSREARAALERRPAVQILELMFRLKAREFYNRVRVDGEPHAMQAFREDVHQAWLINSCASTACHGGQQSGNLWLNNASRNAAKTIYTNFLILDRYRLADGTPLIDYEAPARSPLLQMTLPRVDSLYPHPLVSTTRSAAWRPIVGSVDDREFVDAVAWINAMYRPRPDYPVSYDPPKPVQGIPQMPSDPIGER